MNILIPMAGLATRFVHEGITTPKPLIEVAGKPLIQHTLETLGLKGTFIFVTRRYEDPAHNTALSLKLKELAPGCREIMLETPTRGAVETCMAARDIIDTDEPLIVTNCDQRTEWDPAAFMSMLSALDPDGAVVTHESKDPKHSYAVLQGPNGTVSRIVEKKVVSSHALVGIHYWKHGRLFVQSAQALLTVLADMGTRECYVSETYNSLIDMGLRITAIGLGPNQYIPLGTPYDVAVYEGKLREYSNTDKPRTLFIDLDGTILKHAHRFSDIRSSTPALLDGVLAKLNEWDSHGHRIILCTARKEGARALTERQLETLGVPYDQLLMGLTSGPRVVINDRLSEEAAARAIAINVITDAGFGRADWAAAGL